MSSTFVPVAVLNCMQESHHQVLTSHIEEVPVEPTLAPGFTIVGGPSQAPVMSAALATIASFKPLGITYLKAVQKPPQSIAGSSSKKAPFNMEKEHELLKKAGVRPTVEPLHAMHKMVEQQDIEMDKVLGKYCKFTEFATKSAPVQNAIASTSTLFNAQVELLLLDRLPVTTFGSMKEYDADQKKHHTRSRKAKKAKKESVHCCADELPHGRMLGNVQVFPEVNSNPVVETREPLFFEENLKVFPNSPLIINPRHPYTRHFKALIESLNLENNEGHLNDPSLDMNHHTDYKSQENHEDEPLDWGTPSAQDYESSSSSKDSIGNELAAMAGISRLSLTPAPSNRSSKGKGKQREQTLFNADNRDDNLDSHAYDYGYNMSVSTNLTICTLTKDEKSQLLSSLSSLESRVELFCNKCSLKSSKCMKCGRCKTHKTQDKIEIMADSSTSNCFTHTQSDLSEFVNKMAIVTV